MELYTIAKMAKIIKIPESTARYYRDRHLEFLPGVGSGRKRRYKKEALEVLRLIADLANRNLTAEEINDHLSKQFNRSIEIDETTAITTTAEQQQAIVKTLSNSLTAIADQKKEIQELRERVNSLEKYINENKLSWWQKLIQRKQEK